MVPALVAAAVLLVVLVHGSGDGGYTLRVQLADAGGLRKDFLVKISGAPVGKVTDVRLDRDDRAIAVLRLDSAVAPVGADASAAVRASNLLGEKYVDVVPGDVSHPAPSGFLIPLTRTDTPSDLDDVLSVLDSDTRVALTAFLVNQGDALVGRGGDLAASLNHLPPMLDQARELVTGLAADNRALGDLLVRSDRILATVIPQRAALGRLVQNAAGAFDTLDSRRAALGDTVRRAPAAIRQLRTSLIALDQAAGPLAPAARGLERTAAPLTSTLQALPGFAAAARPTLQIARDVAPDLGRLGRRAAPVVRRLAPLAANMRTFATHLEPVTRLLDDGIADTLGVMQGWARSIQNRDAAGHVFRVSVELGGDVLNTLNGIVDGRARTRTSTPAKAPRHHSGPAPASPAPADLPAPLLPGVELPKLPVVDDVGETVTPLLDFLLKP
ncbi:MAG: phospholipid/cholesterol/gamma-HCH transport system substrate-binding protein [Solirubrobacteraceae bacterium]|nr:phospholipid/cholesterol/gamma-HCH transport system substrate-binding protein [Solirubrobacteraceae bacterium]